jgi:hypothetical protein
MARVVTVSAEVWVVWLPALHALVGRHGAHGGSSHLHRRNKPVRKHNRTLPHDASR